jgi:hypothetical protein
MKTTNKFFLILPLKALRIFAVVFLLIAAGGYSNSELTFCNGWVVGYKAGYCYEEFACIPPSAPLCPAPRLGEYGYMDGYNRGFVQGFNDSAGK